MKALDTIFMQDGRLIIPEELLEFRRIRTAKKLKKFIKWIARKLGRVPTFTWTMVKHPTMYAHILEFSK